MLAVRSLQNTAKSHFNVGAVLSRLDFCCGNLRNLMYYNFIISAKQEERGINESWKISGPRTSIYFVATFVLFVLSLRL